MLKKDSIFLFFLSEKTKKNLNNSKKFSEFTSKYLNVIFILDSDEKLFESLDYLKNRDIKNYIFVDDTIFRSNEKFFIDIKNYFNPHIVLIIEESGIKIPKEFDAVFSQKLLIDDVAEVFEIYFENAKLENFILGYEKQVVQDKLILMNIFFKNLENLKFYKSNSFDFKYYYNFGKNLINSSFWYRYDDDDNFWFFDFIINDKRIDLGFIIMIIQNEWEKTIFENLYSDDLLNLLNQFYNRILLKYKFISRNNLGVFLLKITKKGKYSYDKINYNSVFEIERDNSVDIVSGNIEFDSSLKNRSTLQLKKIVEGAVINDKKALISDYSKYGFVFSVKNVNKNIMKKSQLMISKSFERTGIIKIFDLLELENIVSKIVEKIKKIYFLQEKRENIVFLNDLKIVLRELVINALEHGTKFNVYKDVLIHYYFKKDRIIFTIEDQGNGFDYKKSGILDKEYRRGKGLFIVKNIVDKLYFNDTGNIIRVEFSLKKWRKDVFKINNDYFWNN